MTLPQLCWATGLLALVLGCGGNHAPAADGALESNRAGSQDNSPAEPEPPKRETPKELKALLGPEKRLWMPVQGLPCEGPEDAPLTVVEYVGYQCPFSRRHEATVQKLLDEYRGRARFCVRQFVISADQPDGVLAAYAALESFRQLGAETFFKLHRTMLSTDLNEAEIFELAKTRGVNLEELRASLKSNRYADVLKKDRDDLYALDKSGTPNLFVNGRVTSGSKAYEEVAPLFQNALEESSRLITAGLPAERIYDFTQSDAIRSVEKQAPRPGEPVRVRIRFIHVPTTRHPLATQKRTIEEARVIADDIVRRVKEGDDFGALAREFSAASNKARGGEFGTIVRGSLTDDIEDVAFALEIDALGVTCGDLTCAVIQRQE